MYSRPVRRTVHVRIGHYAWVDVEVTAREAVDRLAVVIWFCDETQYIIFDTSTERLGYTPFSLRAGEPIDALLN